MKIKQITDINTNEEKREELQSILDKDTISSAQKKDLVKKDSDGICLSCNKLATKQIIYDIGDSEQRATVIERYCSNHWSKRNE